MTSLLSFAPTGLNYSTEEATTILTAGDPNSTSLSRADLQLAGKSGLKAVVAVGHDGSQYIASAIVRERLLRYYDVADRHAYTAIRGLIASGHASIAEANRWHHHAVNKGLARAGIMDYRAAALTVDEPAWIDEVADRIAEAIVEI